MWLIEALLPPLPQLVCEAARNSERESDELETQNFFPLLLSSLSLSLFPFFSEEREGRFETAKYSLLLLKV